jgi:hypothetical protein
MNPFLEKLIPKRLRTRAELKENERLLLFSQIQDADPALRAILDRLQETLEAEFYVAIDPGRTDVEKLRSCEGMRVAFFNLKFIEDERDKARDWVKEGAFNRRDSEAGR